MSHVKIGERYGAAQGSSKIVTRAAPVADPARGIETISGSMPTCDYVIQVRPAPAPPAQQETRSWVDEEAELELELERATVSVHERR